MSISTGIARLRGALDRSVWDDPAAVETVVITWDPDGVDDDVLDLVTLRLEPAHPDAAGLYEGPALIAPDSTRREPSEEGGAETFPEQYTCRLPASAPSIPRGAAVKVTASPKAHLVDRRFVVDGVPDRGRHVTSTLTLHSSERGPRL